MRIAKIFQSGNSQAVRLPKELRFETSEVEIFRRGAEVVLRERRKSAAAIFEALAELPSDMFSGGRPAEPPAQELFDAAALHA